MGKKLEQQANMPENSEILKFHYHLYCERLLVSIRIVKIKLRQFNIIVFNLNSIIKLFLIGIDKMLSMA